MTSYGTSYAEFKTLVDEFEQNPTLQNYVTLRRRFPRGDLEVARFVEMQPLQMQHDLEPLSIDPFTLCDALDGDERAIDEVSLVLMERIIEREALELQGQTHIQRRGLGITDALINYIVVAMLEVSTHHAITVPSSLLILIRERLAGAYPLHHQRYEIKKRREDAVFLGVLLSRKKQKPTMRLVAKIMRVEPSTVSRWFPDGGFAREVDRLEKALSAVKAVSASSSG